MLHFTLHLVEPGAQNPLDGIPCALVFFRRSSQAIPNLVSYLQQVVDGMHSLAFFGGAVGKGYRLGEEEVAWFAFKFQRFSQVGALLRCRGRCVL